MLIFAVSEFMFGAVNAPVLLFAAGMLGGIGAAMIFPAVMAYTADITTEEERGKGMGLINAAITTGFIIGPGIGGYIADFGIRIPFYAAGLPVWASIITLIILPESARSTGEQSKPIPGLTKVLSPGMVSQLLNSYREPYFFSLIIVFVMAFSWRTMRRYFHCLWITSLVLRQKTLHLLLHLVPSRVRLCKYPDRLVAQSVW